MNVLYFLTPKAEVEYISVNSTVRQGLEKMRYHGFSAIPVIDDEGRYKGTVTEGDFLWALYNDNNPDLKKLEKTELKTIIHKNYHPCRPPRAQNSGCTRGSGSRRWRRWR